MAAPGGPPLSQMPELPEVETFARTLQPELAGATIASAEVRWRRTIAMPSAPSFKRQVQGQQILGVGRRAKFLILQLTTLNLLIHLRMSGDLRVEHASFKPQRHDRLILYLQPASKAQAATPTKAAPLALVFNDTRKFGRVWLTDDVQKVTGKLGPEPLDPAFTARQLLEGLHAKRRLLKPLLLDQTFIAGLGNIYTDESLNLARLHPLRRSDSITPRQAERLLESMRSILSEGIRWNGASIDWVYRGGNFQNHFRVYDREGEPCPRCGTRIRRVIVGQRSTHFCPRCQKV